MATIPMHLTRWPAEQRVTALGTVEEAAAAAAAEVAVVEDSAAALTLIRVAIGDVEKSAADSAVGLVI